MLFSKFMNFIGSCSADFNLVFLRSLKYLRSWLLWSAFRPAAIKALVIT